MWLTHVFFEVIEKYTNLVNPTLKNLKKDGDKFPKSPNLKGKKENEDGVAAGSSCSSGSGINSTECLPSSSSEEVSSSNADVKEEKKSSDTKGLLLVSCTTNTLLIYPH